MNALALPVRKACADRMEGARGIRATYEILSCLILIRDWKKE